MRNKIKITLSVLSFLFCTTSYAQPADDLSNLLLNIHTMQADFNQAVKDKSAHSISQSQGHMALQRPGKFRWQVVSPTAQLIIANGKRLWIYDPDLEQVTIQTVHAGTGKAPALLLSDQNLTLSHDYDIKTAPALSQIAGLKIFELTPVDKEDPLDKIKLTFIGQQIKEMQLQDRLGHNTVITFNNVVMDKPVPDKLFTFSPPPNVDVIDETKDPK
jgi:outer membrane lipoprotein carrier protein